MVNANVPFSVINLKDDSAEYIMIARVSREQHVRRALSARARRSSRFSGVGLHGGCGGERELLPWPLQGIRSIKFNKILVVCIRRSRYRLSPWKCKQLRYVDVQLGYGCILNH